jgi:hypothetical protein
MVTVILAAMAGQAMVMAMAMASSVSVVRVVWCIVSLLLAFDTALSRM